MDLNHEILEAFFGWKWMAFDGSPVRGTPNYNDDQRVRQFFPPEVFSNERWKEFFAETNASPAIGTEPLAYCYCSSVGPHWVPDFTNDENECRNLENEIRLNGKWKEYTSLLAEEYGDAPTVALVAASRDLRCRVALQFKPEAPQ